MKEVGRNFQTQTFQEKIETDENSLRALDPEMARTLIYTAPWKKLLFPCLILSPPEDQSNTKDRQREKREKRDVIHLSNLNA